MLNFFGCYIRWAADWTNKIRADLASLDGQYAAKSNELNAFRRRA